jgi:hypothetical protein
MNNERRKQLVLRPLLGKRAEQAHSAPQQVYDLSPLTLNLLLS